MRGKHPLHSPKGKSYGNIPAYAGKTGERFSRAGPSSEHPRVCGENNLSALGLGFLVGTSPRMRGKLFFQDAGGMKPGNIPAYAGKTALTLARWWNSWEHPRVCGENSPPDF